MLKIQQMDENKGDAPQKEVMQSLVNHGSAFPAGKRSIELLTKPSNVWRIK